jgi:mannose-6-phosphate isomerase-like protein (cupin superfamily)
VRKTWAVAGGLLMLCAATTFSQSGRPAPPVTFVTAAEVTKVLNAPNAAADNPIKIVDMGKYNISLAVLKRGKTTAGAPVSGINHTQVTEVYYVIGGAATLVTGTDVKDVRPIPANSAIVREAVGPSNTATFVTWSESRPVVPGDMVIIPAGVYHGFSEIADHIDYVSMRPDVEKVLPAGYLNPAIK